MGLYENMARLKEANLCNIVLVPSRLSASGRNKLYYHQQLNIGLYPSGKCLYLLTVLTGSLGDTYTRHPARNLSGGRSDHQDLQDLQDHQDN